LETLSTTELGKKIGKTHTYVGNLANNCKLLATLDMHGMKAEYYASNKKRESGEAILPEGTGKSFNFVKAKKPI
jgi:glutathionyl-hydroquinone reductase